MPEVIKNGETGYLVENIGEAVEALQDVPALDRNACRRWVEERFSQRRMVEDYLKVYAEVVKRGRP